MSSEPLKDHKFRDEKILILGLGNEVLGDEGLGIKIGDDLKKSDLFPGFDYQKSCAGGLILLELIQGYDSLLVIDTTCGNQCAPGTIHHYTQETFRETLHLSSEHDASFLTVLETGKRLGLKIPHRVDVLAVEIIRDLNLSEKYSDIISKQYDKIRSEIIKFIKKNHGIL